MDRYELDGRELSIVLAKDRRKTPDEMRPRGGGRRGGGGGGDYRRDRDRGRDDRRGRSRSRSRNRSRSPDRRRRDDRVRPFLSFHIDESDCFSHRIVAVVVFLVVIPREVVMKADAQDEIAAKAHGNKAADRPPRTLETTKNLKKRKTSKL